MILRKLAVVIVALALGAVAIGVGYIILAQNQPVPPVPGSAPTVTFTSPAYAALDVPISAQILATFSQAMDPATIGASTFTVRHGTVAVQGTVTYDGLTATFAPLHNLVGLVQHTATITTGAKDSTGVALAVNVEWPFTTAQAPDTIAPQVSFTSPVPAAVGTAVNAKVLATFSEAMNPATISISTFSLRQGTNAVAGTVSYAGTTAVFDPTNDFAFDTTYTATISTGVKDVVGNALAVNFVWTFKTGIAPETIRPLVSSTSPVTNVALDSSVSAMFSEVMDPLTINGNTFLLYEGTTALAGVVTYASQTATFNPNNNFQFDTTYRAVITTGAADLAGNTLQPNFEWTFRTGSAPDIIRPQVSFATPAPAAVVAIDSGLSAMFSENMDPTTITVATFLLSQGANSVSGLVAYSGMTATFDPTSDLAYDTAYTATVTTGAKDLAGNSVAVNYQWSFRTILTPDTDPPLVVSTSPTVDVLLDSQVSATFSEPMDPSTITVSSFLVYQGTTSLGGLVNYAGVTATFDPTNDFEYETTYTATITTGAKDLAGNGVGVNFVWTFTTGPIPDTLRPTVTSVGPYTDVALDANISATFSEAMDPTTVTVATFSIMQGTTPVVGLVSYVGDNVTFNPDNDFAENTTYTATITTGARDLAGNNVEIDFVWTFTTRGPTVDPCALLTVVLGRVSTFAVLAGSTVVNTGNTVITGDIGASPGDAFVGFPPGTFTGTQYNSATVDAAQAMENLTVAYNDAAGRTLCPTSVSGNIGGSTLAPGLYKSTSGLEISSGDLTLDAGGNADAIWIFQIASTLDTSTDRQVILAGGAQAKNIFWQVGTSATLGTTSIFKGTIMADQAITCGTGADIEGRLLARIAAVNLDGNVVSVPV